MKMRRRLNLLLAVSALGCSQVTVRLDPDAGRAMDAPAPRDDAFVGPDAFAFRDVLEARDTSLPPDAASLDALTPPDAPNPDAALAPDAPMFDAFSVPDAYSAVCGDQRLYFRFEEASGVVVDESGCGNHGTATSVLRGEAGPRGGAYRFGRPGVSDAHVVVPDSASLGGLTQFTIEMWLRDSGGNFAFFAMHGDDVTLGRFAFGPSAGHTPLLQLRSGPSCSFGGMFGGSTRFPADTWTHLAMTVDTATGEIVQFMDGLEAHHEIGAPLAPPLCDAGYPFFVGGSPRAGHFYGFNGWIDEVRIWAVVRTQPEICVDAGGVPGRSRTCAL